MQHSKWKPNLQRCMYLQLDWLEKYKRSHCFATIEQTFSFPMVSNLILLQLLLPRLTDYCIFIAVHQTSSSLPGYPVYKWLMATDNSSPSHLLNSDTSEGVQFGILHQGIKGYHLESGTRICIHLLLADYFVSMCWAAFVWWEEATINCKNIISLSRFSNCTWLIQGQVILSNYLNFVLATFLYIRNCTDLTQMVSK